MPFMIIPTTFCLLESLSTDTQEEENWTPSFEVRQCQGICEYMIKSLYMINHLLTSKAASMPLSTSHFLSTKVGCEASYIILLGNTGKY